MVKLLKIYLVSSLICIYIVNLKIRADNSLESVIDYNSSIIRDRLKEVNDADIEYLKYLQTVRNSEEIKIGLQLTNHANTIRIILNNISIYMSIYVQLKETQIPIKKIAKNTIKTNFEYMADLRKVIKTSMKYPLADKTLEFGNNLCEVIKQSNIQSASMMEVFSENISR